MTGSSVGTLGRVRILLAASVCGVTVVLDQVTKLWANRVLAAKPPVEIFRDYFHLVYHRNAGGVFGLLSGEATLARRLFFIFVSLFALGFVIYLIREWGRESRASLVGLSLIAGGAVGNLIDRVSYGKVVDFIDWHWRGHHWPTFNIADSAITCGTLLLVFALLSSPHHKAPDAA